MAVARNGPSAAGSAVVKMPFDPNALSSVPLLRYCATKTCTFAFAPTASPAMAIRLFDVTTELANEVAPGIAVVTQPRPPPNEGSGRAPAFGPATARAIVARTVESTVGMIGGA